MWTALSDNSLIEFYREMGDGWTPMVRIVAYLQRQPFAAFLFASTSVGRLFIHLAPRWEEREHYPGGIGVSYHSPTRMFNLHIEFDDLHIDSGHRRERRVGQVRVEELEVAVVVNSMIQRFLMERPLVANRHRSVGDQPP
jgi:hypothetical protein